MWGRRGEEKAPEKKMAERKEVENGRGRWVVVGWAVEEMKRMKNDDI